MHFKLSTNKFVQLKSMGICNLIRRAKFGELNLITCFIVHDPEILENGIHCGSFTLFKRISPPLPLA